MGKYDATFSAYLKVAWDNLFHKNTNLIVVLCGSGSAWINDEILKNTGFVGRVSSDLVIRELPPSVCLKFWGRRASRVSSREVFDVLSVTGGIPRYLEEIDPRQSVRTVLVYDGDLSAQLEADNYFDYLLPAERLLLDRTSK